MFSFTVQELHRLCIYVILDIDFVRHESKLIKSHLILAKTNKQTKPLCKAVPAVVHGPYMECGVQVLPLS